MAEAPDTGAEEARPLEGAEGEAVGAIDEGAPEEEGEEEEEDAREPAEMTQEEIDSKVGALRMIGKEALAKHDFAAAKDALCAALELYPTSYKLLRLRCVAHACLGDYKSSLADAERVIALNQTSTDGWYYKGFALYHSKQYVDAAHAFQSGLALNPNDMVLQQGFWDSLTLLSQHRVTLPHPGEIAEEASAPMDGAAVAEMREAAMDAGLVDTVVTPGGDYVGLDTPAPTAREGGHDGTPGAMPLTTAQAAKLAKDEAKKEKRTSLVLDSADATGFTSTMTM